MPVICGFAYQLNAAGVRSGICSLNARWGTTPIADPNGTNYNYNAPILDLVINRNSASNYQTVSFGMATNSGYITIKDDPELFVGWEYENLADYMSKKTEKVFIDIYIFSSWRNGALLETLSITDAEYSEKSRSTNLTLEGRLLSLQKHFSELIMSKGYSSLNYSDYSTSSPASETLAILDSKITEYIYSNVNRDELTGDLLSLLVIPRPYAEYASLWGIIQKFCEVMGANMFEVKGDIRFEYSYLLR